MDDMPQEIMQLKTITEYTVQVVEAEVGESIDIPSDARDVEIEYFSYEETQPGIGGGEELTHAVRVKYLEPVQ